MNDEEMKDVILNEILIPSLVLLYKVDYNNILFKVSERNICARLALYLENKMRRYDKEHRSGFFNGYYADVEYDKMNNGDLKQYETPSHRPKRMISDLLIHSRGVPRNLLALEMKQKKNYNKRREDRERLMAMVSTRPDNSNLLCVYDTLVGTFIIYSSDKVKIEVYENVDGNGINTESIDLLYNDEEGVLCRL